MKKTNNTTYTATLPNGETVTFTTKRQKALTHGVVARLVPSGKWVLSSKHERRDLAAREVEQMLIYNTPDYANPKVVALTPEAR